MFNKSATGSPKTGISCLSLSLTVYMNLATTDKACRYHYMLFYLCLYHTTSLLSLVWIYPQTVGSVLGTTTARQHNISQGRTILLIQLNNVNKLNEEVSRLMVQLKTRHTY